MEAKDWPQVTNLLCVRLDSLGDVLMTTPAIRALKGAVPGRRISLMTSGSGARAAAHVPEIDDVIRYDAPWLKSTAPRRDCRPDLGMIERVRAHAFEAAVIFTAYSQSPLPAALFCFLAGIPRALAYCRENPYQLLAPWLKEPEPERGVRHEVQRQLDLAVHAGAAAGADTRLSFSIPAASDAALTARLQALGMDAEGEWVVVHPGATAPSRRYDPDKYAAAGARLRALLGCRIMVTGAGDEAGLVRQVCNGIGTGALALVDLPLGELAALLRRAAIMLCNNTGPVHLAAALGTPVVDLYALTNPQHTPWQVPHRVVNHDVPCRNCYKSICPQGHQACLQGVPPQTVVHAALSLLHETGRLAGLCEGPRLHPVGSPGGPMAPREPVPPLETRHVYPGN